MFCSNEGSCVRFGRLFRETTPGLAIVPGGSAVKSWLSSYILVPRGRADHAVVAFGKRRWQAGGGLLEIGTMDRLGVVCGNKKGPLENT